MNEEIKSLIIDKVCNWEEDGVFDILIEKENYSITANGSICRQYKNDKIGDEPDYYELISREVIFSEICICWEDYKKYLTVDEIYEIQDTLNF